MPTESYGGRGVESLPPWVLAAVLALVPVAAPAAVAPQVQSLLRQARVVVAGDVTGVTPYDQGRVVVATVRVGKTLKGELVGDAALVVEMRDRPNTAPIFRAGEEVVVFLRPADKNSYLRKQLPAAEYYQVIADHACLSAKDASQAAQTRTLVERVGHSQQKPDPDPRRRAENDRALTFDLIAARDATLVQDGAASLGDIPDLAATLRPDERQRLETALGRDDLPPQVRVSLVRAIGAARLKAMIPALRALHDQPPEVQAAVWATLAQLGAPPSQDEWEQQLSSSDAGVRAVAVREYLRTMGTAGIGRVGSAAVHDPDASVRVAAIKALGKTQRPEALPPLQQAFTDESAEIYQAAVQAINEIGGRPAAEVLAKLSFDAPPPNQRLALTALLFMVGPDDPLVVHIAETHPNPDMRDLIQHGIKLEH